MASECEGFARQSTKLKEQGSTPVEATELNGPACSVGARGTCNASVVGSTPIWST